MTMAFIDTDLPVAVAPRPRNAACGARIGDTLRRSCPCERVGELRVGVLVLDALEQLADERPSRGAGWRPRCRPRFPGMGPARAPRARAAPIERSSARVTMRMHPDARARARTRSRDHRAGHGDHLARPLWKSAGALVSRMRELAWQRGLVERLAPCGRTTGRGGVGAREAVGVLARTAPPAARSGWHARCAPGRLRAPDDGGRLVGGASGGGSTASSRRIGSFGAAASRTASSAAGGRRRRRAAPARAAAASQRAAGRHSIATRRSRARARHRTTARRRNAPGPPRRPPSATATKPPASRAPHHARPPVTARERRDARHQEPPRPPA